MFDCSKEVLGYHDSKVTLPQKERDEMRDRRNANRDRVKRGLKKNNNPKPWDMCSQGSYAMKTMVQHPAKDYDIDDGIYFDKDDLKGAKGADKTALEARQMVRDAVDDGGFKKKPEARKHCVRVYYDVGYHVDIPVYRRVVTKDIFGNESVYYELASSDWKRSDARDVTAWFDNENKSQSPDETNGRQLRRMCRDIKKFLQSRDSWKGQIGSGFMITKLVTECYVPDSSRDDKALYNTMKAIRDRLNRNLEVKHPVTPNETITKGSQDPKARFLRDKLSDAITWLGVLFSADCQRKDALKAWDKVFSTTYFSDQLEEAKSATSQSNAALWNTGLVTNWSDQQGDRDPVKKGGGGRYA